MIEYDRIAECLARAEHKYLRLKRECEVSRDEEDRGIAVLARCFLRDSGTFNNSTEDAARRLRDTTQSPVRPSSHG
jgi:hypothetical protein